MALTEIIITHALTKIASDPEVIGRLLNCSDLPMPNIETDTLGGQVFWDTLSNVKGWRLQKNKVFGNYRIIDPNNIRRAWGGGKTILKLFQKIQTN